jgi:hypothetical protein
MWRALAAGAVLLLAGPSLVFAQMVPCRGYPESVANELKRRIEAVRLLEREAADRLTGLDTRTYGFLAGEARKAADLIADERVLKAEEGLSRCRNSVRPVRTICRSAAMTLAAVLDEFEADRPTRPAKAAYAEAAAACERLFRLPALDTAIRKVD